MLQLLSIISIFISLSTYAAQQQNFVEQDFVDSEKVLNEILDSKEKEYLELLSSHDHKDQLRGNYLLAQHYWTDLQHVKALDFLKRAEELCIKNKDYQKLTEIRLEIAKLCDIAFKANKDVKFLQMSYDYSKFVFESSKNVQERALAAYYLATIEGSMMLESRDINECIVFSKFAIENLDVQNSRIKATLLHLLGMIYFEQKNYDEAIKYLKLCSFHNACRVNAYGKLAEIFILQNNYKSAWHYHSRILDIGNKQEQLIININLAKLFLKLDNFDRGLHLFQFIFNKYYKLILSDDDWIFELMDILEDALPKAQTLQQKEGINYYICLLLWKGNTNLALSKLTDLLNSPNPQTVICVNLFLAEQFAKGNIVKKHITKAFEYLKAAYKYEAIIKENKELSKRFETVGQLIQSDKAN